MRLHHATILFLGLGSVTLTAGCYSLPAATSGQIGCAEKDITIADEEQNFGSKTWTATCEGKTYYCSAVGGGQYAPPQISCKEQGGHASAPPPAAPAPAAGCQFDTQCKGDRLCKAGRCVDPPTQ